MVVIFNHWITVSPTYRDFGIKMTSLVYLGMNSRGYRRCSVKSNGQHNNWCQQQDIAQFVGKVKLLSITHVSASKKYGRNYIQKCWFPFLDLSFLQETKYGKQMNKFSESFMPENMRTTYQFIITHLHAFNHFLLSLTVLPFQVLSNSHKKKHS